MQCEEVRDHFTDYLIDSLEEPVRSGVQQHLIECMSCRAEAEGLKNIWTKLGSITTEKPGPEMKARFEVMLEAYKQGLDHAPQASWWSSLNSWIAIWWPRQPVLQFGLALGLLVVGVLAGQQNRQTLVPQTDGMISELRNEIQNMRQLVALSLMQQQSATERLRGVNWVDQIPRPNNEMLSALLDTLMHDSNVNVRLAAVDALRQFGGQEVVRSGVVQALSQQDSPLVQIALIDFVVELREKASIETLRRLTEDQNVNEAVRTRAERGLKELD